MQLLTILLKMGPEGQYIITAITFIIIGSIILYFWKKSMTSKLASKFTLDQNSKTGSVPYLDVKQYVATTEDGFLTEAEVVMHTRKIFEKTFPGSRITDIQNPDNMGNINFTFVSNK